MLVGGTERLRSADRTPVLDDSLGDPIAPELHGVSERGREVDVPLLTLLSLS